MTCKLLPAERRNILFTARGERQVDNGASVTEKGVKYKMLLWMSVMRPGPGCHSWGWHSHCRGRLYSRLGRTQAGVMKHWSEPEPGPGENDSIVMQHYHNQPLHHTIRASETHSVSSDMMRGGEGGIQSTCNYLEERFVQLSFGW